ncbi:hypothetical protein RRG08_061102 [Elysia crispata]|uniref:Uncharacterized protein n=1 Tax=Elysia crispata TaxID=231223 RepID=A0AAE0ZVU7_9GAST|nr:hypothetical protein RRG08_061102 [Elysia crispata]
MHLTKQWKPARENVLRHFLPNDLTDLSNERGEQASSAFALPLTNGCRDGSIVRDGSTVEPVGQLTEHTRAFFSPGLS